MQKAYDVFLKESSTREYKAGEIIIREGEQGDNLYVVENGLVTVIKNFEKSSPVALGYRGPGTVLGEIALFKGMARSATVMAIEPTSVRVIEGSRFWELLETTPDFRNLLLASLIESMLAVDETQVKSAAAERELIERLASISTEHERLAELIQLRQEMNRFIVHDLRNPLNLIMFTLSLLKTAEERNYTQEYIEQIQQLAEGAIQRMLTLVDALLEVERLDSAEAELDFRPIDLFAAAQESVDLLQPMASTYHVALVHDLPQRNAPPVPADQEHMKRVLANLIDNALKFTPPEGTVTIRGWFTDDEVFVAVDDSGPGLPPDQLDRVFDRFVQVDAENEQSTRGFGLGLAFCRSTMIAHKGKITAENRTDGSGARFVFSLPIMRIPEAKTETFERLDLK